MVSVSVISMCLLLVSFFGGQIIQIQDRVKMDRQIEWHLFLNQLEYELTDSTLEGLYEDSLVVEKMQKDGKIKKVSYERYQSLIRRRVGGEGHQPMLTKIRRLVLKPDGQQIRLEATFLNNERYVAFLTMPKEKVLSDQQEAINDK